MRRLIVLTATLAMMGADVGAQTKPERKPSAAEQALIDAFEKATKDGDAPSKKLRKKLLKALAEEDLGIRSTVLELLVKCEAEIAVPALESALLRVIKDLDKHLMKRLYFAKSPKDRSFEKLGGFASALFLSGVHYTMGVIGKLAAIKHPLAEDALCRFLKKHKPQKTPFNILWKACTGLANFGTYKSLDASIKAFRRIEYFAFKPAGSKPKRTGTRYNSGINVFGSFARLTGPRDLEKIHREFAAAFEAIGVKETPEWKGEKVGKAWASLLTKHKKGIPLALVAK